MIIELSFVTSKPKVLFASIRVSLAKSSTPFLGLETREQLHYSSESLMMLLEHRKN